MTKMLDPMAVLADCKFRKIPFILLEGETDINIYENVIKKYITDDEYAYELKSFGELYDESSGGCGKITNWIKSNYDDLKKIDHVNDILLAFIDGDAYKYKILLGGNKDKENEFLYRLNLYSIESYAFSRKCLKKLLVKYMDIRERELEDNIINTIYEHIKFKTIEICEKLAKMCLLVYVDEKSTSTFRYKLNLNNYNHKNKIISELDKEIQKYNSDLLDKIESKIEFESDFYTIKEFTKGKHLVYIISIILREILQELQKSIICENNTNECMKEISCTRESICTKKKCSYKISENDGKPKFDKQPNTINFIYSDIIEHFDLDKFYNEVKDEFDRVFKNNYTSCN